MNYRSLLSDLRYRGVVRGARRAYHVYEGPQHFVLLSPSDGAGGYYHGIERQALNYILDRVGGTRSITAKEVLGACRRSKFFKDRFSVLSALYALAGVKKARITGMKGQALVFSVAKGAVSYTP